MWETISWRNHTNDVKEATETRLEEVGCELGHLLATTLPLPAAATKVHRWEDEKTSTVLSAWGSAGKLILPGSWPCLLGLPFQVWFLCSLLPLWSGKGLIWLFTVASRRPSEKSLEDALNFVLTLRYPRARTYSHKWPCLLNYGVWGTWVLETNWMFS